MVHAGRQAAFAVALHGMSRHGDDRHVPVRWCRSAARMRPRCFQAVEHRHLHVHQHQVERLGRDPFDGGLAVAHDRDVVVALQQPEHQFLVHEAVFGQQDPQAGQPLLGCVRPSSQDAARLRVAGVPTARVIASSRSDCLTGLAT